MGSPRFVLLFASLTVAMSLSSYAQVADSDGAPAHLAYVDGDARIDRDNDSDPAAAGMPVIPGDRLTTERGRVEILFPDGSAVDVDEGTIVELQAPELVRLTRGRIVLVIARGTGGALSYSVDTPAASIDLDAAGEYRISTSSGTSQLQTVLAVVRGSAALVNDAGQTELRAGQRSTAAEGSAPSRPESFNSARADAFFEWAESRRDDRFATRSRDLLPDDLRPYAGELERNGSWGYESGYGDVWYPSVAADWEPYSDGYWSPLPTYGWTWVGVTPWSWPTHHYGRWGYAGTRWFWIPERRWAPAWVSWGTASGYVSWSPLGFDNRPVFAWSTGYSSKWKGWTVLPRDRFVSGRGFTRQWAVKPGVLPQRTAFITSGKAPVLPPRVATRQLGGGDRRDGRDGSRDPAFQRSLPPGKAVSGAPSASPKLAPPADRIDGNRDRPARDAVPGANRVAPTAVPGDPNGSKKEFRNGGSRAPSPGAPENRGRVTPEAPAPAKPDDLTTRPPDPRRGTDFRTGTSERRAYPRSSVAPPPAPAPAPSAGVQPPPPTPTEPRGSVAPYRGSGDKGRTDTPVYAPRQAPPAAAPPSERVAPRAEPRAGSQRQESAPPAVGKAAQPQSSGGEGKGASQGGSRGDGGSGKGKR